MADKVDLVKLHPQLFKGKRTPVRVTVPSLSFLTIEGKGAPGSEPFGQAVGALFGVAYTLKFTLKEKGKDFKVAPLEGFYWLGNNRDKPCPSEKFSSTPSQRWRWQLQIMVPKFVTKPQTAKAIGAVVERKGERIFERVQLGRHREGRCLQVLHIGPYDQEDASIRLLEQTAEELGLTLGGPHHEIYLSDPSRTKPERLKTILRHPIAKGG